MTRFFCSLLLTGSLLTGSGLARTYYFDSRSGDDAKDGSSERTAWRSLEKFNATTFAAGDRVLFKSGGTWTGQMRPQGSGIGEPARNPITLGRYGEGALPEISGEGKVQDTLLVQDVEHWDIRELSISNKGPETAPNRTGVRLFASKLKPMHGIVLSGLHVHDVNGDLRKSHEGTGIFFEADPKSGAAFDGVLIERCKLERTDRNGICQRGTGRTRSTRVIIRGNVLEDIGGDGIKLWGTNGGLIERNIVRGARARCDDHAAGIWPFACDDTIVQFNEVSGTKGTKDGQAFDSDYICNRTIIQYNYSFDNEGGFLLVCSPGWSFNRDTIVRYNVSIRDGINSARVIQIGGAPTNTRFHNNTFVLGPNQDLPVVSFNEWDRGNGKDTVFERNLFIVAEGGRARYDLKLGTGTVFRDNFFSGRHEGLPDGAGTVTADWLGNSFVPAEGIAFFSSLKPDSRAKFPRGIQLPGTGGRELFGMLLDAKR